MSFGYLRKQISGSMLTLAVILGVGISANTTVHAQHRSDHPHTERDYGYERGNIYQVAYDNGYHDGVEHGAEHRNEGHRYDVEGTRHYKDATDGYDSYMGSKDAYKQAYREGFRRGYAEGYRGGFRNRDGYYGNDPYRRDEPYYRDDPYRRTDRDDYRDYGGYGGNISRIAYDQGYRDGIDHALEHRRNGERYDPRGTRHYKDATEGYRSQYGNKDEYKRAYREGFLRGYDEGYRNGGGYSRGRIDPRIIRRFPWPF